MGLNQIVSGESLKLLPHEYEMCLVRNHSNAKARNLNQRERSRLLLFQLTRNVELTSGVKSG